jgi:hypothetical protein
MTLPTITATCCWTKAEEALAKQLANSPTFRTLTGTASEGAALARVWIDALPEAADLERYGIAEYSALFPYGLIYSDDQDGFFGRWAAHPDRMHFGGTIRLVVARTTPSDDIDEVERDWKNLIGQLIEDMAARVTMDNELGWSSATVSELLRSHEDEYQTLGDRQVAVIEFEWGNVG